MKIVVAKPGYDALQDTNPDHLVFSSDYNTLKYYLSGTITVTIPGSFGYENGEFVIVTHNLGYPPFFVVFANDAPSFSTRYYALPFEFADVGIYDRRLVYTSNTQLIFRFENTGFGINVPVELHYKIFKNNLSLP